MSKYKTYSKFGLHLLVQNNYVPYQREVELQLRKIRATAMGRALFEAVASGSKDIRIVPHSAPHAKGGEPANNPFSRLDKSYDWQPEDAMEAGSALYEPALDMDHYSYTVGTGMFEVSLGVGTGLGADTVVEYSPAALREEVRRSRSHRQNGAPDAILIHELTHAMRAGTGLTKLCDVRGDLSWENYEEFCGHLVENVYRSESGMRGLRLHRLSPHLVDKRDAESDVAFYRRFADDINDWFDRQPSFFRAASFARADFNPFRAAAQDRDQRNSRQVSYPPRSRLFR